VTQLDRDTVLIALESMYDLNVNTLLKHKLIVLLIKYCCNFLETVKIVNMQGVPSKELVSNLDFDFSIETLGTNLTYEKTLYVHNDF